MAEADANKAVREAKAGHDFNCIVVAAPDENTLVPEELRNFPWLSVAEAEGECRCSSLHAVLPKKRQAPVCEQGCDSSEKPFAKPLLVGDYVFPG